MKEGKEILNIFKDEESKKEVSEIRGMDPLDSLRSSVVYFFEGMLRNIQENDHFKNQLQQNIIMQMEKGEIDVSQVIGLYKNAEKEKSSLLVNLFNIIFKPSSDGDKSPLFNVNISGATGEDSRKLTAKEYESADKVERVLQHVKQRKEKETEEEG